MLRHWFDLDNNVTDKVNTLTGTVSGAVFNSAGKIDGCYTFSTNNKITIPGITLGANCSIGIWAKATSFSNNVLFGFENGPNLYFSGSTISWTTSTTLATFKNSGIDVVLPSTNVWHNYVVVNNRDKDTTDLYVDGAYYGAATYVSSIMQNKSIVVGNYFPSTAYAWVGDIDDVRIYDEAIPIREVQEISRGKFLHFSFETAPDTTDNLLEDAATIDFGWSNFGSGYTTITQENGYAVVNITDKVVQCGIVKTIASLPLPSVTFSVYCKPISRTADALPGFRVEGFGVGTQTISGTWTNIGQWQRISVTINNIDTEQPGYFIMLGTGSGNITCEFTKPQIEVGQYLTEFATEIVNMNLSDASGYRHRLESSPIYGYYPRMARMNNGLRSCYIPNVSDDSDLTLRTKNNVYIPEQFTLMYWIKGDSADQTTGDIFPLGWLGKLAVMGPEYGGDKSGVLFREAEFSNASYDSVATYFDNNWHHAALTFDSINKNFSFYKDGEFVETVNFVEDFFYKNTYAKFMLGAANTETEGNAHCFIGDVRAYATIVNASYIKEVYQSPVQIDNIGTVFTRGIRTSGFNNSVGMIFTTDVNEKFLSGTVGYWKSENFSSGFKDLSYSGNDTTAGSGVSEKNGVRITTPFSVPYSISLAPTTELTIFAKAYHSNWRGLGAGVTETIVSKEEAGGYSIELTDLGLQATVYVAGKKTRFIPKGSLPVSGTITVAMTFDNRYMKMYLNGSLIVNADLTGAITPITYTYNNSLVIGGEVGQVGPSGLSVWSGNIQEVLVANKAAGIADISYLNNKEASINDKGILYTRKILEV